MVYLAVTIRQIAAAAGVSRGTVDRVLHNRPGVKPGVAEHVRKIAEELGYSPNRAGQILAARKRPILIGCFMPNIGNVFFNDVIKGFRKAEKELSDFGVSIIIREARGYDMDVHKQAIQELMDQGCDGLCVATIDTPEMHLYLNQIIETGIPVVAVNTDLGKTKKLCYVGNDYYKAGATAAGLLSLMLTKEIKLLIVTGSMHMKGHNDRIRGFSRTLRRNNIPYHVVDVCESQDNDEHACNLTMKVLKEHPETDCIYIVAAGVAGVCQAVKELDRQNDLRIVSHDDVPVTRRLVKEGVIDFTVCQEPEQQGYQSIHILFNYFMSGRQDKPKDFITGCVIKTKENIV